MNHQHVQVPKMDGFIIMETPMNKWMIWDEFIPKKRGHNLD